MKKLTIEEKANRYDKAIEIAKSKIRYDRDHILNEDDIIAMFPELKKSEDEIIRKALLEMVNDTKGDDLWINYNVHKEDAAAWLERQTDNESIRLLKLKAKAYILALSYPKTSLSFTYTILSLISSYGLKYLTFSFGIKINIFRTQGIYCNIPLIVYLNSSLSSSF